MSGKRHAKGLYILCQFFGVLDNILALIIIYALINLPIAVWMAHTYFCEVPGAILEAARIDGATIWEEIWHVLRPMTLPGLSSTGLLLIILSWNPWNPGTRPSGVLI